MESKDFKNSKQLFSGHILINRSENEDGEPVGWIKIRIFYGSNEKGKMEYVTSLTEDSEVKIYSMLR